MLKTGSFPLIWKKGLEWILAALVLLLSVYLRFSDLPRQMDLRLYDESYYLTEGVYQPVSKWQADYSALYSLWYRVLASITGLDALDLYFLNYGIWTIVLGGLVFGFSRFAGLRFPLAISWALLATAAQIGLPLWPKAGHFAMLGSGILFWFFLRWREEKVLRLLLLSGGMLLLSWARPEFFAGSVLALGFGLYHAGKGVKIPAFSSWIPVLLVFGIALLFGFLWGLPVGRSGRGMVAFGQHFVHNWRMMQGADPEGLHRDWVNWREICLRVLGTEESIFQAIRNQPFLILKHLTWNVGQLIWVPFQYFFETIFPQRFMPFSVPVGVAVLFVGLDALSGFTVLGKQLSKGFQWVRVQGFDLFPLLLPPVLAGLIFQARAHYLLPLFPVFVYGVGKILAGFSIPSLGKPPVFYLTWLLPVFLVSVLPGTTAYFRSGKDPEAGNVPFDHFGIQYAGSFPHRNLVEALRKSEIPSGSHWFDASTGAAEFLGTHIQRFGKVGFELNYPEIQDFERFVKKNDIRFILLHPTMDYDHVLRRNPFLSQLRKEPAPLYWEKRKLTDSGDSLLIRSQR